MFGCVPWLQGTSSVLGPWKRGDGRQVKRRERGRGIEFAFVTRNNGSGVSCLTGGS